MLPKISNLLEILISKKEIVIFGAMNGNWYGDNAKYMFEFINNLSEFCMCG